MNILEKYLGNVKKFWVKLAKRFWIISGEKFEENLRKIERNFDENPGKVWTKINLNSCVNLKKL